MAGALLSGCTKEPAPEPKSELCQSENCVRYFNIWKKVFMERNNMSADYFNAHIAPVRTSINTWNSGESFNITYNVNVEWMSCKRSDQFIVKTSPTETTYPALDIRRGEYLNEEEIKKALDQFAFSSEMNVIGSYEKLAFASVKDALIAIQKKAGQGTFKFSEFSYTHPNMNTTANGHPLMTAYAEIDYAGNKCIAGTADLATGDCVTQDTRCWVQ